MRIVGIAGSLRSGSHNAALLRSAAELLPDEVTFDEWHGLGDVPAFSEDEEHTPPAAVTELRALIASADAVLVATPEYNASIPGQLKNALDWLSRPARQSAIRSVPVAVIGTSTGTFGAAWAQADLRRILGAMGARVVDAGVAVPHAAETLASGALDDPELRAELAGVLDALLEEAELRSLQAA